MASKTVAKLVQTQLHKEGKNRVPLGSAFIVHKHRHPGNAPLNTVTQGQPFIPHHVSVRLCVPETDRRT